MWIKRLLTQGIEAGNTKDTHYTGCQGKVDVDNTKIFPLKMACIGLVIIAAGTEVVVGNTKNTDCQSK